jgi:hypothetical protein
MDEPVNAFTIRQRVWDVAERLERELGDEQFCFIEGIDGGYVRGQHKQGHFEVIAGKSLLAFKRDQEEKQELSRRWICLGSDLR